MTASATLDKAPLHFAVGDAVLYIGLEPFGSVGQPMVVSKAMGGISCYELTAPDIIYWGMRPDTVVADTPQEREASAARVAALIETAMSRRDERRARISELRAELKELEREEHYLDPTEDLEG